MGLPARHPIVTQLQTLLHLAAWCQVGVILRIELDALFGGACASGESAYGWAPCVTSSTGALFADLPPNALGSFIMGMLASSDVLSKHLGHVLADEAPLAALPRGSSLQVYTAFQIGVRTGFCGSLTTFSSWMMQAVVLMVGGHPLGYSKWVEGLFSLALNVWVCMAALVTGQHMCLMMYHWLNPGAFTSRGEYGWRGSIAKPPPSPAAAPSSPLLGTPSLGRISVGRGAGGSGTVVVEDRRASSIKNPEEARQQAAAVAAALAGPADGAALERAASLVRAGSLRRASPVAAAAAAAEKAEGAAPSAEVELVVLEEEEVGYPLAWWVADALSLAALALLTIGSIYWAATKTAAASSPFANSGAAIAILLGPPGALLRFRLSRYNGSLKALKWFPLGTFAANMVACVIDYAIRAGIERAPQQLPFTHEALLTGIMLGFCGSLSTVSTWVVELQLLMLNFPAHRRGYIYLGASVATPVLLGVVIYGVAVWTGR